VIIPYDQLSSLAAADLDTALAANTAALDPGIPVLLLPVRLETRYSQSPAGTPVLQVRVYPDVIHVDGHNPAPTQTEREAGQRFWSVANPAGGGAGPSAGERSAAWARLCAEVGSARAEWVARTTSSGARVTTTADSVWSAASQAALLPDVWVATAWRSGQPIATATSGLITRPLHVGPDPKLLRSATVDPGMLWMTDFTEALKHGMALTLPLTDTNRIDVLTVVGVRASQGPDVSAEQLADLLTAHRYTDGLDLALPGEPTNRTAQTFTPPTSAGPPSSLGLSSNSSLGGDAARLALALGLKPSELPPLSQADLDWSALEQDAATALWPGTWGYFLEQMVRLQAHDAEAENWRRWMLERLRPAGPLPTLRVGNQPYGILPLTPLARWRPPGMVTSLLVIEQADLRGTSGNKLTLRNLEALDDRGRWTADTSLGPGPVEPSGRVRATAGRLAGAEQHLLIGGLRPWGGPEILVGPVTRSGWTPTGSVDLPDPIGPYRLVDTLRLVALCLAAGRPSRSSSRADASGSRGTPLLLVVLELADSTGLPRPVLLIGQGLDETGQVTRWSEPIDVSPGLDPDEEILAVAVRGSGERARVLALTGPRTIPGSGGSLNLRIATNSFGDLLARAGPQIIVGPLNPLRVLPADELEGGALAWGQPMNVGPPLQAGLPLVGADLVVLPAGRAEEGRLLLSYVVETGSGLAHGYVLAVGSNPSVLPPSWDGPFNLGTWAPGTASGAVAAVQWPAKASQDRGLGSPSEAVNLLQHLAAQWLSAIGQPLGQTSDPARLLIDALASDAISSSAGVRAFVGTETLQWLDRVSGLPAQSAATEPVRALLEDLLGLRLRRQDPSDNTGPPQGSRLLEGAFLQNTIGNLPFQPVDGQATDLGTQIANLLNATPQDLHNARTEAGQPLVVQLLRHSLLLAYANLALRLQPPDPRVKRPIIVEPELVDPPDFSPDPQTIRTLTALRHLIEGFAATGEPLRELVWQEVQNNRGGEATEVRAAMARLSLKSDEVLARLVAGALDLATHRLDAWITGFTTGLLDESRRIKPTGVHIGAYGMVTALEPDQRPPSTGYVYAPSLTHAATATILRSGFLSHDDDRLNIDLSSRRVRHGLQVMRSVAAGQPLAGVIGMQFEQGLAARRLAADLPAWRALLPLEVGLVTPRPAGTPVPVTALTSVVRVDGLALLARHKKNTLPWGHEGLPKESSPAWTSVQELLDTLSDGVDAIADIGVAEGVHQYVQRNLMRASGAADSTSRGDAPLPLDPDVLRTPRTGIGLTHRVVLAASDDSIAPGWSSSPRGSAEPRLNAWLGAALPDPRTVGWSVVQQKPDGTVVPGSAVPFTLANLELSPLDLVALATAAGVRPAESELGARMRTHAAAQGTAWGTTSAADTVAALDLSAPPRALVGLDDVLVVAAAFGSAIARGRAATPTDFVVNSASTLAEININELRGRAMTALDSLTTALEELREPFKLTAAERKTISEAAADPSGIGNLLDVPIGVPLGPLVALIDKPSSSALGSLDSVLAQLAGHGIDGAQTDPGASLEGDSAALLERIRAVAVEASKRKDDAKRRADAASNAPAAEQATQWAGVVEAVFGPGFRCLPIVAKGALDNAVTPPATRTDVADWIHEVADIREAVASLRDGVFLSGLVGAAPLWSARQTRDASPQWIARAAAPGAGIAAGSINLTIAHPPGWDPLAAQAGLVMDAWVETIPAPTHDTAVAFHLDAPDAQAPQALLLAVHPDPGKEWTTALLGLTVLEALDLARMRTVDPDLVPVAGHVLPAVLFAANPAGDTISMDVGGLT
jgi:hypothetical protein